MAARKCGAWLRRGLRTERVPDGAATLAAPSAPSLASSLSHAHPLNALSAQLCTPEVGSRIEVFWSADNAFYPATVRSVVGKNLTVAYDDGDEEGTMLDLTDDVIRPTTVPPPPPPKKKGNAWLQAGSRCEVWWPDDLAWYPGTCVRRSGANCVIKCAPGREPLTPRLPHTPLLPLTRSRYDDGDDDPEACFLDLVRHEVSPSDAIF